jgi:hypothetical protein
VWTQLFAKAYDAGTVTNWLTVKGPCSTATRRDVYFSPLLPRPDPQSRTRAWRVRRGARCYQNNVDHSPHGKLQRLSMRSSKVYARGVTQGTSGPPPIPLTEPRPARG